LGAQEATEVAVVLGSAAWPRGAGASAVWPRGAALGHCLTGRGLPAWGRRLAVAACRLGVAQVRREAEMPRRSAQRAAARGAGQSAAAWGECAGGVRRRGWAECRSADCGGRRAAARRG
jgi:hypothetical protein